MIWYILTALGLVFVFEGILPFLSPYYWRRFLVQLLSQSDYGIRIMGLISMLIGLGLVTIARYI